MMPTRSATSSNAKRGVAAVCLGTVLWGSAAPLGKAVHSPALVLLVWRQVIAVAVLSVVAVVRHRRGAPVIFERHNLRFAVFAAAIFPVHLIGFFGSARLTSVAIVVLIYALSPVIIIPIAAHSLDERPQPILVVMALIAIGGIALVVSGGQSHGSHPVLGFFASIGNVALWVVWSLVIKRARGRRVDTLTWMLSANTGALVVLTTIALASGQHLGAVHGRDWLRIAALAVGPGLIGHGLNTWALRHIDLGLASVIGLGEPVLAALGAALFLNKSLNALQLLGIAVVIAAVGAVISRERVQWVAA